MIIDSVAQLRTLYPMPKERALRKQLDALDDHCRRFVALSPFVVVASGDAAGGLDASPRGGAPGFVRCVDAHTMLIPDAPGNNRLDTLENIVATGRIGLLFMIPGVDETLRVNGGARLTVAPERLSAFADDSRPPKLVIEVSVREAYLHCAKALMRSSLWDPATRIDRAALPTMGRMIADQIGASGPVETQQEMLARYAADL